MRTVDRDVRAVATTRVEATPAAPAVPEAVMPVADLLAEAIGPIVVSVTAEALRPQGVETTDATAAATIGATPAAPPVVVRSATANSVAARVWRPRPRVARNLASPMV